VTGASVTAESVEMTCQNGQLERQLSPLVSAKHGGRFSDGFRDSATAPLCHPYIDRCAVRAAHVLDCPETWRPCLYSAS
jgi:hypothetical protein